MSTASQAPRKHPDAVLYPEGGAGSTSAALPCVDHYAGSEKLMRKALALQAERGPVFDITFDCEDGAPVGAEFAHATLIADLINSPDNRFERVGARIHDITHPSWQHDIRQIVSRAGQRIAFITLPKARHTDDVRTTLTALRAAEHEAGVDRLIPLHVLIETHGALHEVWQIAALPGVASLDFGLMDFVSAHQGAIPASGMRSPAQFDHPLLRRAKCEIVAAALANGVTPTHNVCTDIADIAVIASDAHRAREEFGFLRMWSIHPNQIAPILSAMQPALTDIAEAGELLIAAQDADWGPIQANGRLHDRASYRFYWNLLKRAQVTGSPLPEALRARFFESGALQ